MAEKNIRKLTPVGFAKWAHLHTPKPPFIDANGKAKGEPKFQVDICFSTDEPAWKDWANALAAEIKALPTQIDKHTGQPVLKQMPIKRELDADDKPTGRYYVTFKTNAKFKPGIFDKFGEAIPESILIGNESKIRVSYTPAPYDTFGGGIALYLNAVQVLELVEYQSQNAAAYGFEVEALPNNSNAQLDDGFNNEFRNDIPFAPHGKCGAGVSWRML